MHLLFHFLLNYQRMLDYEQHEDQGAAHNIQDAAGIRPREVYRPRTLHHGGMDAYRRRSVLSGRLLPHADLLHIRLSRNLQHHTRRAQHVVWPGRHTLYAHDSLEAGLYCRRYGRQCMGILGSLVLRSGRSLLPSPPVYTYLMRSLRARHTVADNNILYS